MNWKLGSLQGVALWSNPQWWSEGIAHGFLGKIGSEKDAVSSLSAAARLLQCPLHALRQVHGNGLISLDTSTADGTVTQVMNCEGDGIVVRRSSLGGGGAGLALVTADCAPILLRNSQKIALIHAGWRGMAKGIIQKGIEALGADEPIEGVVGPCVRAESYEVGLDVVEALGRDAVARRTETGRFFLSIPDTALAIAERYGVTLDCIRCDTVTDQRFHSHRREGTLHAARNITFVAAPRQCASIQTQYLFQ